MVDQGAVVLTPRGLVLAVLATGLGAGAWAGGVLELAVVGGALAASLVGAAALVVARSGALRGATLELLLPSGEVVVGSAGSLGVVVRDVAGRTAGDLCVDDPTDRWDLRGPTSAPARSVARSVASRLSPTRMLASSLEPLWRQRGGQSWAASFPFPTAMRGLVHLAPLRAWCTDPLRLVARHVGTTPEVHRLVVPRPLEVARPRASGSPEGVLGGEDVVDLRAYVPGDRLTHVHWPSLARGREPLVRRLVADGDRHLELLLDFGDPTACEQVVGAAAGLGIDAARHGAAVDVWTSTGQHWSVASGSSAPGALLRVLATVGPGSRLGPAVELVRPPVGVVAVTTLARRDHMAHAVGTASVVVVDAEPTGLAAPGEPCIGQPGSGSRGGRTS